MPLLHDLLDNLEKGRVFTPSFRKSVVKEYPDVSRWIASTAADAQCFDIGPSGDLPMLKLIPDLFRLPFPVTWLEGKLADGTLGILMAETGKQEWDIAVINRRLNLAWNMVGVARMRIAEKGLVGEAVVLPESNASEKEQTEYIENAVGLVAARFLMALNCTNTRIVEHAAPKALNRMRERKGRRPLFSYWTLHLPNDSHQSGDGNGSHASPRLHLRRGHIRQYAPGRYTWVESCLVGSAADGIVSKDYAWSAKPQ
jgi:hypothetical protein